MHNELINALKGLTFWKEHKLNWVFSTSSTNEDLKAIWRSDKFDHTIEIADLQTHGKGQYDRKWSSDEVGQCLMFSFTVDVREYYFPISMMAGVSLALTLESLGADPNEFWLKWPNDIWINDKKLAGILTESTTFESGFRSVVGIGINILPLQDKSVNAASLSEAGVLTTRENVLLEFCRFWDKIITLSDKEQCELWNKYGGQFWKRKMNVKQPKEKVFTAIPESVEKDGTLIVRLEDGNTRKIISASLLPIL